MIEKIYNCKVCRNYAKSIAGEEHEEIFSLALEKIIVQNPQNVENYKSYFYTTLRSVYLDWLKDNRFVELDETTPDERDEPNYYKEALKLFLEKQTNDEEYKFYQDLIYLSFENSKLSLCKKLKLRRADLDVYLAQAKKLIKNEYIYLINN